MQDLSFRVYFGGTAATTEDLLNIEEITVEQSEDIAWEARMVMTLCLNEKGQWEQHNKVPLRPRTQVRVELKIGKDPFKPLIEGPIVAIDTAMDSRPGRSTATITVHDDSAWLNLEVQSLSTEDKTDEEVATELFTTLPAAAKIAALTPRIEIPDGPAPPALGAQFSQLGTPMQMLRYIATRNGCRAYVLPGDNKGESIGCVCPDPSGPATLPALVLAGGTRNLAEVTATEDPESSARATYHTLQLSDQQVVSYTTAASDEELIGDEPAAPEPATRMASPLNNDSEDPRARAAAEARLRNFPVHYAGRLLPGCYPKILQPFQKVPLHAGGTAVSATILLTKVTHSITPSGYSVEFEGRGNSLTALGASAGLPTSII